MNNVKRAMVNIKEEAMLGCKLLVGDGAFKANALSAPLGLPSGLADYGLPGPN